MPDEDDRERRRIGRMTSPALNAAIAMGEREIARSEHYMAEVADLCDLVGLGPKLAEARSYIAALYAERRRRGT